jgi:hypothetical protein
VPLFTGGEFMANVSLALLQLATRLRQLREEHWRDYRLTQSALATALGDGKPLASATVSSWESPLAPKLPPADRLRGYAHFFATRRSIEGKAPHLVPLDSLTLEEEAVRKALEDELLSLREKAVKPGLWAEVPTRRSWHFSDSGPVTIVCAQLPAEEAGSLADPSLPNYAQLQSFADLDSLVELYGHMRRENPDMVVSFKASTEVTPNDLSGHVVLLGGIAWNEITDILSEMTVLPVRQIRDAAVESGEIFIADINGTDKKFLPTYRGPGQTNLKEDVGLLARTPNPLNSNRTLTICNGVHSRGVLGAVRTLTDKRLSDSNERYLAEHFKDVSAFAVLMRVHVIEGRAMTPDFNTPGCVLYRWPEGPDS